MITGSAPITLTPLVSGCSELRHQLFCVAAFDRIKARLVPIWKLDRQQRALLAQFQRTVKSAAERAEHDVRSIWGVSFDCKSGRRRVRKHFGAPSSAA